MRRRLQFLSGALVGLLLGGGAMLATARPPVSSSPPTTTGTTAPATTTTSTIPTTDPIEEAAAQVLLVWTPGRLAPALIDGLGSLSGAETVTVAYTDLAALSETRTGKGTAAVEPGGGMVIPVEITAVDRSFSELVPAEWQATLEGLEASAALLTETSAGIRGVGVGGTLRINGEELRVVGVLPDIVLGGAEVVVNLEAGARLGITTPRYALAGFTGDRAEFEAEVREMVGADTPVRVRAPGETPFLRNGDAVLPQAYIKRAFGEFAIDWDGGSEFQIDPLFVSENIVTSSVPLLGEVTCHAGIVPSLEGAMRELEQANLGFLVKTFHGCFNPRFIGGTRSLSRHAWGVAVDINYTDNVTGQTTTQDARLVEVMGRFGFTWGGNWLIPDAAHFEWVAPPEQASR